MCHPHSMYRLPAASRYELAPEPGVTAMRSVKMRWIGHRIHADAELDIDPATSLIEAHRIAPRAAVTDVHGDRDGRGRAT